jgi:hypothetical protein
MGKFVISRAIRDEVELADMLMIGSADKEDEPLT